MGPIYWECKDAFVLQLPAAPYAAWPCLCLLSCDSAYSDKMLNTPAKSSGEQSFLAYNTYFGAITYKRKKINVLHNEHFPLISETIQRFLQARYVDRDIQCSLGKKSSSSESEGKGSLLEYLQKEVLPTQVTKCAFHSAIWYCTAWKKHWTQSIENMPMF